MKNRMKRPENMDRSIFLKIMISMALFCALLIAGCGGDVNSYQVKDTEYHVGSNGIILTLLNSNMLNELYENSSFSVSLLLENRGAHDIQLEEEGFLSLSFDPFYVSAASIEGNQNTAVDPNGKGAMVRGIRLYGKSKYYPTGETLFFAFANLQLKGVLGQRENPETSLFMTLCYPYTTVLSKLVCVDMNSYRENLRKQVCTQSDLSLSDQGAPVAVSSVEVDNQPVSGDLVRPVFIVRVTNRGRGTVLSPAANPAELERVCTAKDLRREDFNTVYVTAALSESLRLKCNPNPIRLYNEEGFTQCSVQDEDLNRVVLWHQNYEAPLSINLSYVYQESLSQNIQIKRFDIYGGAKAYTDTCQNYEMKINGACVPRCDFCASHQTDSSCQPANAKFSIAFDKSFGCKCSIETCNKLYPTGLCVPFATFCPGASFCCTAPCKTTEARSISDGLCYPKCSSCSNITKSCICNPDESPASRGYCCTKTGTVLSAKAECTDACK
jgi:hypothetical protein